MFPWEGTHMLATCIPRKPHPVGFVSYALCGCFTNLDVCFVVDFQFDTISEPVVLRRTPREHLIELTRRVKAVHFPAPHSHPSVTLDAAFGGSKTVKRLLDDGWLATASLNTAHEKALVVASTHDLPVDSYRCFYRDVDGVHYITWVYSVVPEKMKKLTEFGTIIRTKKRKIVAQTSSLFRVVDGSRVQLPAAPPAHYLPDSTIDALRALPRPDLLSLAVFRQHLAPTSEQPPTLDLQTEELLSLFAGRPIDRLPPQVGEKRRIAGEPPDLSALLAPHRRRINAEKVAKRDLQRCKVEGCSK